MFQALDYYKPPPPRAPVISPSLTASSSSRNASQSPTRNATLDAARARHKQRQLQREQRKNDSGDHDNDEDDYEDATASTLAVCREVEELRARSRPMTPNKVRLAHTRSPYNLMIDDEERLLRAGSNNNNNNDGDVDEDDGRYFGSSGGGVFMSPNPPHQLPQQQRLHQRSSLERFADPSPSVSQRRRVPLLLSGSSPLMASAAPSLHPMPPPSALSDSSLAMLKEVVPFLSDGFSCTEQDAQTILSFVQSAQSSAAIQRTHNTVQQHDQDKISILEGQVASLSQRLERKQTEAERLRDDVADARGRYSALEQRFRNTQQANALRKEESRKQLLCEESKVSKLTLQCKNLQMEVDRLRRLLHDNLGTPASSSSAAAAAGVASSVAGVPRR